MERLNEKQLTKISGGEILPKYVVFICQKCGHEQEGLSNGFPICKVCGSNSMFADREVGR